VGVALLAGFYGDGEAVLRRRERAGGVGRIGTGRVVELVEVEDDRSGLVEAVIGEWGAKEAGGFVCGGLAGVVAKDEEERGVVRVFEHGFKPDGFAVEGEFGEARRGQVEGGADDGGNFFGVSGRIGYPLGFNGVVEIRGVPVQAGEAGAGGRVGVLDAEGVTVAALKNDHGDAVPGHGGGVIAVGGELVLAGGLAVDLKIGGKAGGIGEKLDGCAGDGEDAEVFRRLGFDGDGVVGCGTEAVAAVLEPFEANECEPAIGSCDLFVSLRAPGGDALLPLGGGVGSCFGRGGLRECCRGGSDEDGDEDGALEHDVSIMTR
jgi:hypothetical protein